jgi:hypothetical protein
LAQSKQGKNQMLRYVLPLVLIIGFAQAADDSNYAEIARTRRYAGGADESDLKVQATLYQTPSSKKKKKPVTTEPSEGF